MLTKVVVGKNVFRKGYVTEVGKNMMGMVCYGKGVLGNGTYRKGVDPLSEVQSIELASATEI